jgi:hypothetical protein
MSFVGALIVSLMGGLGQAVTGVVSRAETLVTTRRGKSRVLQARKRFHVPGMTTVLPCRSPS